MCLWLSLCEFTCTRGSFVFFFFKSATACRHLKLPTWQLAPLITNSNTHQWTSNEAFLGELWLAMGLQSIPQFWTAYYGLLRHSLKYTDKTVFDIDGNPGRVLMSDKLPTGDNLGLQSAQSQNLLLQSRAAEPTFRRCYSKQFNA